MRYLVFVMLLVLPGCWQSSTREQTVSVETRQGIEAGQPTSLVVKKQETSEAEARAGVDVAQAVQAAIAGMRGDILGALDKMKPQPVSFAPVESKLDALTAALTKEGDPVFPTGEVVGGGAAAIAALLAFLKHREAAKARAESDESWGVKEKALAALPPEEAKKLLG